MNHSTKTVCIIPQEYGILSPLRQLNDRLDVINEFVETDPILRKFVMGGRFNITKSELEYLYRKYYCMEWVVRYEKDVHKMIGELCDNECYYYFQTTFLNRRLNMKGAIRVNSVNYMKYIVSLYGTKVLNSELCDTAAGYGRLKCLKYLVSQGYKCTEKTVDRAASSGKLHILRYLREIGTMYPPNREIACENAARFGQIECLQYLHEVWGLPMGDNITYIVTMYDRVNCLEYIHTHGGSIDRGFTNAIDNESIKCLEYLHNHARDQILEECPDPIREAKNRIMSLKFLYEHGYKPKISIKELVTLQTNRECADFVVNYMEQ